MAWGQNPFTNYSTQPQPFGGSTWSAGQQSPWGQNSGQFDPNAMNFGGQGGGYGQGGQGGFGGQGGYGMPPWMNQGMGGGGYGMSGGMPPWMNQGQPFRPGVNQYNMPQGGMPPWMQSIYGGMRNGMQGGMNMQTKPYQISGPQVDPGPTGGAGIQNTFGANQPNAQPGAPGSLYGIYSNVIHNGVADPGSDPNNPPPWIAQALHNIGS